MATMSTVGRVRSFEVEGAQRDGVVGPVAPSETTGQGVKPPSCAKNCLTLVGLEITIFRSEV